MISWYQILAGVVHFVDCILEKKLYPGTGAPIFRQQSYFRYNRVEELVLAIADILQCLLIHHIITVLRPDSFQKLCQSFQRVITPIFDEFMCPQIKDPVRKCAISHELSHELHDSTHSPLVPIPVEGDTS